MDEPTLKFIKQYVTAVYKKSSDVSHSLEHVERVWRNAETIVQILKVQDIIDGNLLQAACFLHDIVAAAAHKPTLNTQLYTHLAEKKLNKKCIGGIIRQFHLDPKDAHILSDAIINHPFSIPYRRLNKTKDLYSRILQDADSLDYIARDRENIFRKGKTKLIKNISHRYLTWVRERIHRYLNFPELILDRRIQTLL